MIVRIDRSWSLYCMKEMRELHIRLLLNSNSFFGGGKGEPQGARGREGSIIRLD